MEHALAGTTLTDAERAVLAEHGPAVAAPLHRSISSGLVYATVSTISWTPIRGPRPDVLVVTSDGVHAVLGEQEMEALCRQQHGSGAQVLADALVHAADASAPGGDNASAAVLIPQGV